MRFSGWARARTWVPYGLMASAAVVLSVVGLHSARGAAPLLWAAMVVVSAALVLAAALVNLARVLLPAADLWPVAVVLSALAAHATVTTVVGLGEEPTPDEAMVWTTVVKLVLLGVTLALILVPHPRGLRIPPAALGGALGLTVAVALLAPAPPLPPEGLAATVLLCLGLIVGYGLVARLVHRHWAWSSATRRWAVLALVVLGAAQVPDPIADAPAWLTTARAGGELLAAVLIGGTIYAIVRGEVRTRSVAVARPRPQPEPDAPGDRSQRHAIRNMVAGISMASELLEDDGLEEPLRRRLQHTIHDEAVQLRQLLDDNPAAGRAGDHGGPPTVTTHTSRRGSEPSTPPAVRTTGERHVRHQTEQH